MSYCEVSLGDLDGELASFYDEREIKSARKAHQCDECREAIPAGSHYRCVAMIFEGKFSQTKICDGCWEIIGEFSDGARIIGITWETFQDEWTSGARLQGCLNRLSSVAAKELMVRKWKKWKGLD